MNSIVKWTPHSCLALNRNGVSMTFLSFEIPSARKNPNPAFARNIVIYSALFNMTAMLLILTIDL
jgi:hypothetical protein